MTASVIWPSMINSPRSTREPEPGEPFVCRFASNAYRTEYGHTMGCIGVILRRPANDEIDCVRPEYCWVVWLRDRNGKDHEFTLHETYILLEEDYNALPEDQKVLLNIGAF